MLTAILSTVHETFFETDPTGQNSPRVRLILSDGSLARLASEFTEYEILYSGSTIISLQENGETVGIARVEEFAGGSMRPTTLLQAYGRKLNPALLPDGIKDKRSPDMKGHPLDQIPRPYSLTV